MKHIDDWLDEPAQNEAERAAKEWLEHFRRPAISRDHDWLSARVLTCEYRGKRYRCIGASRMGDVWLTADISRENGYDLRIDVAECGEWRMTPNKWMNGARGAVDNPKKSCDLKALLVEQQKTSVHARRGTTVYMKEHSA